MSLICPKLYNNLLYLSIKAKSPTMAYKALHHFTIASLTSFPSTLVLTYSTQIPAMLCLRCRAHFASELCNWLFPLPDTFPQISSLTSFRSRLKNHFSMRPSLASLSKIPTTPNTPHSSSLFYFSLQCLSPSNIF